MKLPTDIEQLFLKEFSSFEIQPSPKVWKGVRSDLFVRNFMRFSPRSVNVWYAGAVLLVSAVIAFSVLKSGESNPAKIEEPVITNARDNMISGDTSGNGKQNPAGTDRLENSQTDKTSVNKKSVKTGAGKQNIQVKSGFPDMSVNNASQPSDLKTAQTNFGNIYNGQTVVALFNCSEMEGCAPLTTKFTNNSQNAVRYFWSFGDGGSSELASPSYIFDEPGSWLVSLTAYNANNEMSVFTDIIKVNPQPEARFSMDIQGVPGEGLPVYFYNFSKGADAYLWDFGDGTQSSAKDPDHIFTLKSSATIKLLAISEAGCSDSTVLKDAFKTGEPIFIFPTAFSPNTTGPSSGQYSRKSPENDVFYPFVEEQPAEYQLKIFNRNGILLFESNDINLGWNGYYHEVLVPQGVYVWKARAKFEDGRSVVKMGDVTVLWR